MNLVLTNLVILFFVCKDKFSKFVIRRSILVFHVTDEQDMQ